MADDDLTGDPGWSDGHPAGGVDSGRVALLGLPAAYAAALSAALEAVGLRTTVSDRLEHLPGVLASPAPAALVAAESATALLLASTGPWTAMAAVVVLVLARARPQDCATALQHGATGLITQDTDPHDAAVAVQLALRKQTVLPRELVRALWCPCGPPAPDLSAAERQWLQVLAAGGTVSGLAQRQASPEGEMYRRLSALYTRLGASNRTEALLAAHTHGLLTDRL